MRSICSDRHCVHIIFKRAHSGPGLRASARARLPQVLKRTAIKALGLPPSDGTRFFSFEHIPDVRAFKSQYRRTLDQLGAAVDLCDRLVAEANRAFLHNMRVFSELDVAAGWAAPSSVPSLDHALAELRALGGQADVEWRVRSKASSTFPCTHSAPSIHPFHSH